MHCLACSVGRSVVLPEFLTAVYNAILENIYIVCYVASAHLLSDMITMYHCNGLLVEIATDGLLQV